MKSLSAFTLLGCLLVCHAFGDESPGVQSTRIFNEETDVPDYNSRLSKGMTYEEVVKSLGGEGYETASVPLDTYEWTWYEGGWGKYGGWGIYVEGKFRNNALQEWTTETWDHAEELAETYSYNSKSNSNKVNVPTCTIWQEARESNLYNNFAFRVEQVLMTQKIGERTANAYFVVIKLRVKNTSDEAQKIDEFRLRDHSGNLHESAPGFMFDPDVLSSFDRLNPGVSRTGYVVFDVRPENVYRLDSRQCRRTILIAHPGLRITPERTSVLVLRPKDP